MTFFDETNPNKYSKIKTRLIPKKIIANDKKEITFHRCGAMDGSYVLPTEYINSTLSVLSYGIGDDPEGISFEQYLDREGNHIEMYDGSIDYLPSKVKFGNFNKEFLKRDNFEKHVKLFDNSRDYSILKMDIEGHEYDWASKENLDLVGEVFDVFCIELHSLIEEIPKGWVLEPQLLKAKKDLFIKLSFLTRIQKDFSVWHIHGNNHSPRHADFPDSLEITYINKRNILKEEDFKFSFPIDGLDQPNYNGRADYVLDWWI